MARYALLYTNKRPGLDPVIEADTYSVDGKFFTFLKDKEVVRSLKVDYVVQIKRLSDEDDGDQSEEGDSAPSTKTVHAELAQHNAAGLDELLASMPRADELDELLAATPDLDELLRKEENRH